MRALLLSGRTVIVTRPRARSSGSAAALAAKGARVVFAPLIRTVPPRSWKALDRAILDLRRYDAVAFTSANAVDFFFLRCRKLLAEKKPVSPRVLAAVGRSTAKAVAANGWACTMVPEDARSAGLARILRVPRGSRVLIPRAERGLDTLPRSLRKAGARVTVVPAYRTVPDPDGMRRLRRALALGADAVTFASPSAAVLAVPDLKLSLAAAVAIGPTTAAALRAKGVVPAAVAKRPDPESLARAVVEGLKGRP
ncbi:MAG: uroporphyrinogen-III synthase [Elusimicrobia bacterium]|nr:uroporphyrinogen-III synthase [Elusimicrobiota bacterium]